MDNPDYLDALAEKVVALVSGRADFLDQIADALIKNKDRALEESVDWLKMCAQANRDLEKNTLNGNT